jgi:drug/metabolite transporter (DMT)-like permease
MLQKIFETFPTAFWLITSGIFYGFGEYWAKRWSLGPSFGLTVLVLLSYGLCDMFYLPIVVKEHSLAIAGVMFLVMAMLASIILGVFWFHETISWQQWAGIVLAGIGMLLLSL